MNIKITSRLILTVWMLLSAPLTAATIDSEAIQAECLSASLINEASLQQIVENWLNTSRGESRAVYEQRIQQLESRSGVFTYEIVPNLVGLGYLLEEQADHAAAVDAIQRAIHLIRVNEGLYSTSQLPLLELLIKMNSALHRWKRVADEYDMIYWLYRRNYAADDPRQLKTIKQLHRWYVESYNKNTGRSLDQLFTSAEALYDQALNIMRKCTGSERQAQCFWHKSCCTKPGEPVNACHTEQY